MFYVFDEHTEEGRPIAGPFSTADEAAAVLRDVAYPFRFETGPATVVGDTFMGEG